MNDVLLVNITWNPKNWTNRYINPRAGHEYARQNAGHESLNFKFDKRDIDTEKFIHGFVQWTNPPKKFQNGGLIIFYTKNIDYKKGQVVGVYGKSEIIDPQQHFVVKGFQNNQYSINIRAEKRFSILFPVPLSADNYKAKSSDRMVPQVGFTYKDNIFAKKILYDELVELSNTGILQSDYKKLSDIYEYYVEEKFELPYCSQDEKEQEELAQFYKQAKIKEEILDELNNLQPSDSEEIIVNKKTYKRDNKTIAQIKILRDFKCQICGVTITKKDRSKYIEAAHIKAKHQKGRETIDNIILLCPNHHKEFDLGDRIIKSHDSNFIDFVLNGQQYKISLTTGQ
ncbi:HNH endonuclease [Pelodictyon phaeoclathratiforme]|jgi:putative restriction endonuclease|uniref:HNH nuclease n=1 Tax=Pelodictyon phaeoclathratiforme (strain DSM 5477 / BU-1) TaxID=324925 RepID=B4SCA5_PELPB|nr:HNH endonuclease [Pelodictyon phaeoclathratiforme]ACF42685.1 HNH nuclease [Pelodictyon phaeoclathratiforme BU-1]MBV5288459.1 HNH endonuclease [Pelodictyon phaeoclathratiforme]